MKYRILLSLLLISALAQAQPIKKIRQMAYADSARLTAIFKDIHQNPELGFLEVRTSGIVANELKALGYEVKTGFGKTGLVGILRNGAGPILMYRADMDCNSVREETGLPYASTKVMKKDDGSETPVMHACGHDAHVTWMLGVAKIMAATKADWKGTLVFLAQPAEELILGAKGMVADSMFAKGVPVPDYLIGLHTLTKAPVGMVDNAGGIRMSGSDQLDVTFRGIGGHGSRPEMAKDPVVMACNAVIQYQSIISQQVPAQDVAVIVVGAIHAGTDNNVIPNSATIKVNLRWFSDKTRQLLLDGIHRVNEGIAVANGLPKDLYPTILMKGSCHPLDNNAALVGKVNGALGTVLGSGNIITNTPSSMGSEDFQELVIAHPKVAYDYIQVGVVDPAAHRQAMKEGKVAAYGLHTSTYKVDLRAIPLGTEIGATALMAAFGK